jgi:DNA-binding NarL/FixJ family response regulator
MKKVKNHESKAHSKIKVLIVDDHSLVRRGLAALLSEEVDIDVCGQVETREALPSIRSLSPDVVVVDITMRGAQGLEVIKQTAYNPQIKVIALDLHSEPTYSTRAIRAGAKGYITKNSENALAPAIRRVHEGKLAVSDDVAQQMVEMLTQVSMAPAGEPMGALSDRELEMAELVGKGYSTSQLAEEMKISVKTVETHKAHMKKKLGIAKGSQLVRYCVTWFEQRNALRN